ncbi:Bidirectional sugar transporter SWEET9 [Glycine soja]
MSLGFGGIRVVLGGGSDAEPIGYYKTPNGAYQLIFHATFALSALCDYGGNPRGQLTNTMSAHVGLELTEPASLIPSHSEEPLGNEISTLVMILIADIGGLALTMLIIITFAVKAINRVHAVGWICAISSIAVFAAPLSKMIPNVLGFLFGISQMILYMIYKNAKKNGETNCTEPARKGGHSELQTAQLQWQQIRFPISGGNERESTQSSLMLC